MKQETSPLQLPLRVINIGLEQFYDDFKAAGIAAVQMDWRPPAGGDRRLIALLDSLNEESEAGD